MSQSPDDAATEPSKSYVEGWAAIYELIREGKSWSGRERDVCFLNLGDGTFADISAVAGLDFPEDGRGLGVVDWDLDGAVDFWESNRSGPQLRFLRNLNKSGNHFLAVRLEGRRANRDAIGARLELHRPAQAPLLRWLVAGDGYLSQSSKWVHFGLGATTDIDRLVVTWPGGTREEFAGLAADRRYRLVEGSARAEEWTAPRDGVHLPPPREVPVPPSGAVRTYLAAGLPLRGLDYLAEDGSRAPLATDAEHALLVTLWASWCEQCRHELTELQQSHARLTRGGLRILALSVDEEADRGAAGEFLDSIGWQFDRGYADADLLDVLNIIRHSLVDMPGGMVLPTNFLVDARQELAALYRGPLAIETLLSDLRSLDLDPEGRRDRAAAFPGRWLGPAPQTRGTENLANLLRSRGHAEIAAAYLTGIERPEAAPSWAKENRAESFEYLGRSLAGEGKHEEAVAAYAKGLELDPMRAGLHHAMGLSLVELRRLDGAIRHFENAIRLDPLRAEPHFDLGSVFAGRGRLDEAIAEFRQAAELSAVGEETHDHALYNLGVALDALGRSDEGVEYVKRALAERPDFFDALRFLGYFHQRRNEIGTAIGYYERALAERPDEPRTLHQLGLAHLQAGDLAAARRDAEALRRVDPRSADELRAAIESGGR